MTGIYDNFVSQNCKDINTLNEVNNTHKKHRENRYCNAYEFMFHKPMPYPNTSDECQSDTTDLNNDKVYSDALGYECMIEKNDLLLNPDRQNTFKNYPVIIETGEWCSRNHQMFNNWTRRNIYVQAPNRHNSFKLPESETHELQYRD